MLRHLSIAVLLLFIGCKEAEEGNSFDRAVQAAGRAEYKNAATLFADAAKTEDDAVRRAKAEIRLANIEWRAFRKHDAARARLQRVAAGEHETFAARMELARAALDRKDGTTARAEVREAAKVAKLRREHRRAAMVMAYVVLETGGGRRSTVGGGSPPTADRTPPTLYDPAEIQTVIASLRGVIAEAGPLTDAARMLLKAALIAGDGKTAMEAIDGYYHVTEFSAPPSAIAAAHAALARVLPSWRGTDAERPAIVQGLGGIRFFEEAAVVSRGPATDVVAYAQSIDRIEKLIDEYYRDMANEDEDDDDLKDGIDREFRALWPLLSKEKYDRKRAEAELARRFGTYILIGKTGGFIDCHFAHVVADRTLLAEQYGRKATLRFVELDSIVSNGFGTFISDGSGGDGGWATATEIYQVRPVYADSPLRDWQLVTDPGERAKYDRETAEETARDMKRAKLQPIGEFPGLGKRLHRQYLDGLRGLSREAFLARVEDETFEYSILLHEGRHAIDKLSKENLKAPELEYTAKLSQIALARAPRASLASVVDNTIGGDSPHGKANERLMTGMAAWMQANRASIKDFDPSVPPMPQMDKLTDEQIKAAARSLDPLAK